MAAIHHDIDAVNRHGAAENTPEQQVRSLSQVYALRRPVVNASEVVKSVAQSTPDNIYAIDMLRRLAMRGVRPSHSPGASVIAPNVAFEIGKSFRGNSGKFLDLLLEASAEMPRNVAGTIGSVTLLGALRNPSSRKHVALGLDDKLTNNLRAEAYAVLDKFSDDADTDAIGVPRPLVIIHTTRNGDEAQVVQRQLGDALDGRAISITFGAPSDVPLTFRSGQ